MIQIVLILDLVISSLAYRTNSPVLRQAFCVAAHTQSFVFPVEQFHKRIFIASSSIVTIKPALAIRAIVDEGSALGDHVSRFEVPNNGRETLELARSCVVCNLLFLDWCLSELDPCTITS